MRKISRLLLLGLFISMSAQAQDIKIAFMGPLTGGAAFIGQEMIGFSKAAVAIFNEETGLNVQIVEGDTEINPDVGRIVAERIAADDSVLVVIGPAGSQVCESTQPIFEKAGLAHITPLAPLPASLTPAQPPFSVPFPTMPTRVKPSSAFGSVT
ncbi:MAG: ABC transporter substrate-binding protein [Deinococcales bacterium]